MPPQGFRYIQLTENCHLKVYRDSKGIPTIGWGQTYYPDGRRVSMSDPPLTQAEADRIFALILKRDFWDKLNNIPYWDEMNELMKSAILSASFNLGYHYGDDGFDTLNRNLKEKEWRIVPKTLLLYRDKGTKGELGLARRRYGEGLMWKGIPAEQAYKTAWAINSVKELLMLAG